MTGDTIINGTDIYTAYGAFISLGGYNGVVGWPASKPVEYNDWMEYDGIEVDLSALKLDSREFEISFGIQRPAQDTLAFYDFLCSEPTMTCSFNTLGLTDKTYRVVGMSDVDYALTFGEIRVLFADDSPMDGYEYVAPSVSRSLPTSPLLLGGTPVSEYGVRILYGTIRGAFVKGQVKPFLLRNIRTSSGSMYDANPKLWNGEDWEISETKGVPKYKAIEINIKCSLAAPTVTEFWQNYNAFLWDLTAPDTSKELLRRCERELSFEDMMWPCYYNRQEIDDFSIWNDGVTICFSLSMIAMAGGPVEYTRLLATEGGSLIITEDGKHIKV